jgi:prevent-host-death family protein
MKKKASPDKVLSLSQARSQFSPLVEQVSKAPSEPIPVSVRGEIKAYIVSADHPAMLHAAEPRPSYRAAPPPIEGTLTLKGDVERALARAGREAELAVLQEWGEQGP